MSFDKMIVSKYTSDDDDEQPERNTWDQNGGSFQPKSPDQPQTLKKTKNVIKAYAEDRQRKLLMLILRLATVRGYNDLGNIKLKDGSYMPRTDICPLLCYAVSRERAILGIDEFVQLLREAGVTSDMVTNEALKNKLQGRSNTHHGELTTLVSQAPASQSNPVEPVQQRILPSDYDSDNSVPFQNNDEDMTILPSSRKRQHEMDEGSSFLPKLYGPFPKQRKVAVRKHTTDALTLAKNTPLPYESDSE